MSYSIEWSDRALKQLEKLEKKLVKRIIKKLESIKEYPNHYLEYYAPYKVHKLRVGKYRVFLDWNKKEKVLEILSIWHRDKAYESWG